MAPAAVRLRDVAAHADGRKPDHRLVAVIPLVSDNLRDARRADRLDLLGGRDERVDQGRRVARTRVLHRHAHDGACFQVDRMLGGVRQMRAAVLHLGDLRVRIVRVGPVRVRALLLAGPVEPGQLAPRRSRSHGGGGHRAGRIESQHKPPLAKINSGRDNPSFRVGQT